MPNYYEIIWPNRVLLTLRWVWVFFLRFSSFPFSPLFFSSPLHIRFTHSHCSIYLSACTMYTHRTPHTAHCVWSDKQTLEMWYNYSLPCMRACDEQWREEENAIILFLIRGFDCREINSLHLFRFNFHSPNLIDSVWFGYWVGAATGCTYMDSAYGKCLGRCNNNGGRDARR